MGREFITHKLNWSKVSLQKIQNSVQESQDNAQVFDNRQRLSRQQQTQDSTIARFIIHQPGACGLHGRDYS